MEATRVALKALCASTARQRATVGHVQIARQLAAANEERSDEGGVAEWLKAADCKSAGKTIPRTDHSG